MLRGNWIAPRRGSHAIETLFSQVCESMCVCTARRIVYFDLSSIHVVKDFDRLSYKSCLVEAAAADNDESRTGGFSRVVQERAQAVERFSRSAPRITYTALLRRSRKYVCDPHRAPDVKVTTAINNVYKLR